MKFEWTDNYGDAGSLEVLHYSQYLWLELKNEHGIGILHLLSPSTTRALYEALGRALAEMEPQPIAPTPKRQESPMNLDDYIFTCPTCYDSQKVRVPALHDYKPCPDCAPKDKPEPARSLWGAPKRETPTPFDAITPEMLGALNKRGKF